MDWKITEVEETGSTNTDLSLLAARDGAPEGTVLVARRQTAGRGRQGRTWISKPGAGLFFSFLLRPRVEPARAATVPLLVGAAAADALESILPEVGFSVKWPNDVLAGGRKICGILCEMSATETRTNHVVAGVGINTNLGGDELPGEIAETATSLKILSGRTFGNRAVLERFLDRFAAAYAKWLSGGLAAVRDSLDRRDCLRGGMVEMSLLGEPVSGLCLGIADSGALLLRRDDGMVQEVFSGEAHLLRR